MRTSWVACSAPKPPPKKKTRLGIPGNKWKILRHLETWDILRHLETALSIEYLQHSSCHLLQKKIVRPALCFALGGQWRNPPRNSRIAASKYCSCWSVEHDAARSHYVPSQLYWWCFVWGDFFMIFMLLGKTLITSNSSNSVELQRFYAPEPPPGDLVDDHAGIISPTCCGCLGLPVFVTQHCWKARNVPSKYTFPWPMWNTPSQIELGALWKMSRSSSSLDASGWDSQNASPPRHALRCLFSWFVVWFKQYGFVWIVWFSSTLWWTNIAIENCHL